MKFFIRLVLIISLMSISQLAYAVDIFQTGETLTADKLNKLAQRIKALERTYAIGDMGPAGGWVFYVRGDGRHGLEAAPTDQSSGIRWDNGNLTDTEAQGDGIGAGEMNTMLIIANQGSDSTTYAAGLCANLVITNDGVPYGNWHLPSKFELNGMYRRIGQGSATIGNVGVFANSGYYWTSSEVDDGLAWGQSFASGDQNSANKSNTIRVRAIRAF